MTADAGTLQRRAKRSALVVTVFALAGVLAGLVWGATWDAPTGFVIYETWMPSPSGPDVMFEATAHYVVIASLAGLLLGVLASRLRGDEVFTVLVVLVASLVAGWLMYAVGRQFGGGDPRVLAVGEPDFTKLPADVIVAAREDSRSLWKSPAALVFAMAAMTPLAMFHLLGRSRTRHG